VTWRRWPQRQAFLDRVAAQLAAQRPRRAYYPGSAAKYAAFAPHRAQDWVAAGHPAGTLPAVLRPDLDPLADDLAFREEAWSPVLAETPLAGESEAEYLDAAVRFCHQRVFGSLSVVLLISPAARERHHVHVDRAIAALRYGTVAINHWPAVSFALGNAPWGPYPGHTLEDVGSGIGVVHNPLMFERPLKTVLWGPFVTRPKPVWFVTHQRSHVAGRRMSAFEASPSLWRLPGIAVAAVRAG
jgi:hypothetical protein